jgi:hypothetical protein
MDYPPGTSLKFIKLRIEVIKLKGTSTMEK